jgi:parallel beta-helix repeat protein
VVEGETLYVNTTGSNGAYTSIQDAINASIDGDTVYVFNGTYYENVIVNKSISLIGEDKNITIIEGLGGEDVVNVTSDWVNITGFTISNGYGGEFAGITLFKVMSCKIVTNIISDNYYGISFHISSKNIVATNDINQNFRSGVYLWNSSDNKISNNSISSNNLYGILLQSKSKSNIILSNSISFNDIGINFHSASNNTIEINNIKSSDDDGIHLVLSDNNTIKRNHISSSYWYGIYLSSFSDNNDILGNNISENGGGIYISSSHSNNISTNNLSWNEIYGIYLSSSLNHFVMDNNFVDDGIFIDGDLLHFNTHTIYDDNIVNNQPLYFFKDCSGINLDGIAIGQLILANCTNFQIKNLQINSIEVGLEVAYSKNINVTGNDISSNYRFGMWIYSTFNSSIIDNNASNAYFAGVNILYSSNFKIQNNIISSNYYHGIDVHTSHNNSIVSNNISSNWNGIRLQWSNSNKITANNIKNNKYGIRLSDSPLGNIIKANNISRNTDYGIYISWSSNNRIYHNSIIGNKIQAIDGTNNGNQWDDGYPSGGNYWSDYNGTDNLGGSNQDIPGSDGIGDTNYSIDSDSMDKYPLMEPIGNFDMIDGYYDAVQRYDATDTNNPWKHNKVGKPYGNDLPELNETMGFWIHITNPEDTIFLYNGTQPSENQTITLHPGWNLVGYPSLTSYNRTKGLNNLTFDNQVDAIWTYDASSQKWKEIGESNFFEVGRGYYIHAKTECEWEVPL